MKKEILQYLDTFDDNEYHALNNFLKEHFYQDSLSSIRKNFTFLQNFKLIDIKDATHQLLDFPLINKEGTSIEKGNLENCIIQARIIIKGRNVIEDIKTSPPITPLIPIKKNGRNKLYFKGTMLLSAIVLFYLFLKKKFLNKNLVN